MDKREIETYVDAACAALEIVLDSEERVQVIGHFTRIHDLAAPLLDLPLGEEIESAAIFRP